MSVPLRSNSAARSDSKPSPKAATMIRAISRMSSSTRPRVVKADRGHVDEHQVYVGAGGKYLDAARLELPGQSLGVGYRLPLLGAEILALRDAHGYRLGCDDVHQRPALLAWEDGAVYLLGVLLPAQDHAASWPH